MGSLSFGSPHTQDTGNAGGLGGSLPFVYYATEDPNFIIAAVVESLSLSLQIDPQLTPIQRS